MKLLKILGLKKSRKRRNPNKIVVLEVDDIRIVIYPKDGDEHFQEGVVSVDGIIVGLLHVDGKTISPYRQPMDMSRVWKMPRTVSLKLREMGYKMPYFYYEEDFGNE